MRLKSIKLAGFKTFVDPTTVTFPSNLCAVVGPNGCGKSNIIDAVRWVMGESSAKNLRGEHMTDVIFNGSGGRKPVGQASIELIFDNSDHRITGEYAGFAEIAIRRKVSRDGQSDYFLNGTKCRRRDITDILLGTGLGARSYSIIEQGMISRLIESKPEELRVFIEEAAGISKYKERRKETESRIKRTRENLERLTDIRDELERQLQHLQRQSVAAEKYGEFKQQERETQARLNALRWRALDEELKEVQVVIRELELKIEAASTEHRSIDTRIEKHLTDGTELQDAYGEVQARFYSLGNDIARLEQSIEHHIERVDQLKMDLRETEEDWEQTREEMDVDLQQVIRLETELAAIDPRLVEANEAVETTTSALELAEERMHAWQQEWDEFNQRAEEPRQVAEVEQSRIQQLEKIVERGLERKSRLESERESLGENAGDAETEKLALEIATVERSLEELQSQLNKLTDEIEDRRSAAQVCSEALDEARSNLQTARGKHSSLEALQQAALGMDNEALNTWMTAKGLTNRSRLGESIRVESDWEAAVEAVLGDTLQAVCVDGLNGVADLLADLPDGSVGLVDVSGVAESGAEPGTPTNFSGSESGTPTDFSNSGTSTNLSPLVGKISAGWDAGALFAGIYVAEDLGSALATRGDLAAGESVVTRQGVWLGSNWVRVRKGADAAAGMLERKGIISKLNNIINELESKVEVLVGDQADIRRALADFEARRQDVQQQLSASNRQFSEMKSELSAHVAKGEQAALRRDRVSHELEELDRQLSVEEENIAASRARLQTALDSMEQDVSRKEELNQQRVARRGELESARGEARSAKDSAHELALGQQSVQAQLKSTRETMDRMASQVQRSRERIESLTKQIESGDEPLARMRGELEELLEKRLDVEKDLAEAKARVDENEHSIRVLEHDRAQVEQSLSDVKEDHMQRRLKVEGSSVKRAGLLEQLQEAGFDVETVLREIPEEYTDTVCEEELVKIGNRIQRLGPINLAAIDEYKQQSERKIYLDQQNEDLEKALATLENAIRKIDKETRARFKETFDQINQGLQKLFPRVFGGGHAYLDMTGEDLLDTGVAIMARPPGKRNSTIHLLSGGEKAMTAIALVFSIFQLNPSPFCMLDEVDAPLDDANVGRYVNLVKEMAETVQFVFITHNKLTMESAHQLLGVTMHEPGVSRIVAVDVDEAVELAAM
ncbi:MAG: chromosome segregation protein SMC [Pseudohongiellaceae bacterium]